MRVRGFTLVEVLVSIGVIALLIAILIPVLAGARQAARRTVGLSNIRQAGLQFAVYADTYGGVLPFAPQGTTLPTTPPGIGDPTSVTPGFWDLSFYWPALFHDTAPWEENFRTWVVADPRRDPDRPWLSGPFPSIGVPSYRYSRSLFARPELWSGRAVADPYRFRAPVRVVQVASPAGKALLFDGEAPLRRTPSDDETRISVVFVDTHAAWHEPAEAAGPVRAADPDAPEAQPLHDTPNGSLGADY